MMCRERSHWRTESPAGSPRSRYVTESPRQSPPTKRRASWTPTPTCGSMSRLRNLIAKAVEKHVGQDTGVLLSGGIDSSTVAYFAPELPAFTGYYEGERYDERRWASLMINYSRDWHEIEITPQDFIDH